MLRHPVLCQTCEGTGRIAPHPYSFNWKCPDGCINGYFEATAADLDEKRARYKHVVGTLFVWHGSLTLECDNGLCIVNLQPEDVEILP